jgi:hypothetical protein
VLTRAGIGCWLLKSAALPDQLLPGWRPGATADLTRCVRRSYRLDLAAPGDPVVLWCSGRVDPGVHAVGTVTGVDAGALEVQVRWELLADPVPRGALLADPVARTAEVLRMPAGSNPSYLTPEQWAAVRALSPTAGRT